MIRPPMWAMLSTIPVLSPKHDVDQDQDPDLAGDVPARPVEHRQVQAGRDEDDPEEPEDRARRAGRRAARRRTRRSRGSATIAADDVEPDEPDRPVQPLDDRPDEVQGVHVAAEVEQRQAERLRRRVAVDERDGQEPPDLAVGDRRLVEPQRVVDVDAVRGERRRERDRDRDPEDRVRRDGEMAAAAPGEVAPRGPDVAGLLRQPAEPVRDLAPCPAAAPGDRPRDRRRSPRSGRRRGREPRRRSARRRRWTSSRAARGSPPTSGRRRPRRPSGSGTGPSRGARRP